MNSSEQRVSDFYDRLTPFYHLIYGDWEAAIGRQATQLSTIISQYWGEQVQSILDVSCGISTQAIGLASKGYRVTASDLSPQEIERAKQEARRRPIIGRARMPTPIGSIRSLLGIVLTFLGVLNSSCRDSNTK